MSPASPGDGRPRRLDRPPDRTQALRRAGERTTLPDIEARLTARPPSRCAVLIVTATVDDSDDGFKVTIFSKEFGNDGSRPEDRQAQRRPPFTIAQIMREQDWRRSYYDVASWWDDQLLINGWMRELVAIAEEDGEPVRLWIWDLTPYQIPWELHFTAEHGWLGARMEVLRVAAPQGREPQPHICAGGVVAMEDEAVVPVRDSLTPELLRLGRAPLRTLRDLLSAMDDVESPPALVLVRTHGLSEENGAFTLGGMTWKECDAFGMPAVGKGRPVVVLNACDTALPQVHSVRSAARFVELFLKRGASSVIATVGPVDLDHAYGFGLDLLETAGQQRRVGTLLLAHRRQGADRVWPEPADDQREGYDFRAFFQSFTYVQFGHPDTMLHLVAAAEDEGSRP